MKLGRIEIHPVSDGRFRLDGGAMFGVVPRVMWEKTNPPDDKNRILMGVTPLLVIAGGRRILVDTGIGDKSDEKFRAMYAIERSPTLMESLARHGVTAGDIDTVVCTHLHWDHAGGNTVKTENGAVRPAFPLARYIIQRGEWEEATDENERTRGSYHKGDFVPIMEAGQVDLIDGDMEIEDGVGLVKMPGHNRHFMAVFISSEGEKAVYPGDLIPTSSHLPYPFIMGYDLFPLETLESKKALIQKAAAGGWLMIFEHDPVVTMGYVGMKDGKAFLREAVRG